MLAIDTMPQTNFYKTITCLRVFFYLTTVFENVPIYHCDYYSSQLSLHQRNSQIMNSLWVSILSVSSSPSWSH